MAILRCCCGECGGEIQARARCNSLVRQPTLPAPITVPTTAVIAIASMLQNPTRNAPRNRDEPPARAATAPSRVNNNNEIAGTLRATCACGVSNAATKGSAAPVAKVSADATAACKG